MKDAMSSTREPSPEERRRAIQEIVDQFKIPVEEAEKRLASMTDSIRGSSEQSEEVRRRKAEAISKLPPPRGGHGSAVKVTIGLNKLEAEYLVKLKSIRRARTNAEVFRQLFEEATAQTSALRGPGQITSKVQAIRLKNNTRKSPTPNNFFEVHTLDDLAIAGSSMRVPVIEIPRFSGEDSLFVAIDWSRDFGFFFQASVSSSKSNT